MKQVLNFAICYLCLLVVFTAEAYAGKFILKGKILNAEAPMVYLIYDLNGKRIQDSCKLEQGAFYFAGEIQEPTWAFLRGNSRIMDDAENLNIVDFYLEPTTMNAIVRYNHFRESTISNSKTQHEYELLKKRYMSIDKESKTVERDFANVDYQFILQHPNSYVSASMLMLRKARWPLDTVKSLYKDLTTLIQNSSYGRDVKRLIDDIDENSAGRKATQFKTIDINGSRLSLSDFDGQFILLDFWGSWCVPCRQGTPHLKDLFAKYHASGLNVIGIAQEYDTTGTAWRAAVKNDGTGIWYNVLSNLSSPGTAASIDPQTLVKKYGVHVFPTKILIDRKGMIAGRYTGRGEEPQLDLKLAEVFKENGLH